ncbi:MAG: DUF3786 domain-containing protein [Candidatus Hydrothermarchaeaceae archaeon]
MKKGKTQLTSEGVYPEALKRAREEFLRRDPKEILKALDRSELRLDFLGKSYQISHPGGEVELIGREGEVPSVVVILILRYLAHSNAVPLSGEWAPFSKFSGGIAYVSTFRENAERRILECFESSIENFLEAGFRLGGEKGDLGDASIILKPFPFLLVHVVLWPSDEELPGEVKIFFDGNAAQHLLCEELATLGELIAEKLCEALD